MPIPTPPAEFERFFRLSLDLLLIIDQEGKILTVNPAWERMLGFSPEEMLGSSIFDFIHPEDRAPSVEAAKGLAEGVDVVQFENRYRVKRGGHRWISWSATSISETSHIYAVGREFQAQKEAEERLDASTRELEELRVALDEHAIVSITDLEGRILYANDHFCQISKYSREELLGQDHRILNSGYHSKAFFQGLWESLRQGKVWHGTVRNRAKDGSLYWVSSTMVPLKDREGRPTRFLSIRVDVSETLRLSEQLRSSWEMLFNLSQQIPGVVYQFQLFPDGHSCFPFASEAIRDIYEVSPEEVREDASPVLKVLHPEDLERVDASIAASAQSLEPWVAEYRVVLPRQGLRWRLGVARPQRMADGSTLWHGFVTDITEQRLKEEKLRASEEKFRVLFQQSTDAHLLFDATGIIDCNQAAITLLGAQSKSQLLNLHPAVLSPEFQPDGERSLEKSVRMDRIAREQGYHRFEWIHQKLDGTRFPVEVTLNPVTLQGKPTLLVVWHDLTEQKRAEEALNSAVALLTTTLDSTTDGILVVAKDRSISLFNVQFVEIWRIPKAILDLRDDKRILGYVLSQLKDPVAFLAKVQDLYDHPDESSFDLIHLADGRLLERFSRPHLVGGETVGRVWSFRDVTERAALDRLKSEFVSTVSHELRTPLTSIRGSLGLVSSGALGALSDEARSLVEIACRNSERLSNLINDLLDSEKIESGAITFQHERVALAALLEQSITDNQGYAEVHGIQFRLGEIPPGAEVIVDRGRFLQVMSNLLSNAAKFSPKGSQVEIGAEVEDTRFRISVTDHGSGIPPEFYDRIFQKFSQADSSDTRQKGGTGLGLSITKSIVEKMGGSISFKSQVGRGTTFEFTLRRPPQA
ncbi:MAG: PAS domain S-box protein [Acidobacteria bacterium]|nr:PAS domain S-box protein [Acidobacteriota bacterium]